MEAVRHCRWVDEVVPDAPWVLDQAFMDKHHIDYVAHDEDPYAATGYGDVYTVIKNQGQSEKIYKSALLLLGTKTGIDFIAGKFLPTRRTPGVSTSELLERIVSGYRTRRFDAKLVKMGHAELKAEGSDYDALSRQASRAVSREGSVSPPGPQSPR